jgi:hypothetical protein
VLSLSELFDRFIQTERCGTNFGQFFKVQEKCYPISVRL